MSTRLMSFTKFPPTGAQVLLFSFETEGAFPNEVYDGFFALSIEEEAAFCRLFDKIYTFYHGEAEDGGCALEIASALPAFLLSLATPHRAHHASARSKSEEEYADHGTVVNAIFHTDHIDFTPLGDIISTLVTLIQGHPEIDFVFKHETDKGEVVLDTREVREVLEDTPLDTFEVLMWIRDNLKEQYEVI